MLSQVSNVWIVLEWIAIFVVTYKYWVPQNGMGGILSLGKIWTVPFHSALPREVEQSKFYRAIIFLPFNELKPLNICFI